MEVTCRYKVRPTLASKVAFLSTEHFDFAEDVETGLDLFKSVVITSAAINCDCKRVGGQTGSEIRTAWWNQEIKKAIHPKKTAFRTWSTNKLFELLQLEEFGRKLGTDYESANKVFWQTIHRLRGKQTIVATFFENANSVFLKHQKGIINCWRKYFCKLLNFSNSPTFGNI